jgi:peptidoglycan biosynthesis protein MviN/MurJ (putative lipid II flippase)
VQLLLLIFILSRRGDLLDLRSMVSSAGKSLAASAVMGLVLYDLNGRWLIRGEPGSFWSLALTLTGVIAVGVVVYFFTAWILRCREVSSILGLCKPVFGKIRRREK